MNILRQRPWIFLVLLFCLPMLAWATFLFLARKNPAVPLPTNPPASAIQHPSTDTP